MLRKGKKGIIGNNRIRYTEYGYKHGKYKHVFEEGYSRGLHTFERYGIKSKVDIKTTLCTKCGSRAHCLDQLDAYPIVMNNSYGKKKNDKRLEIAINDITP
jgi:hypothetical protein